jgi:hypothetical protein
MKFKILHKQPLLVILIPIILATSLVLKKHYGLPLNQVFLNELGCWVLGASTI